jgi:hypothetical protein
MGSCQYFGCPITAQPLPRPTAALRRTQGNWIITIFGSTMTEQRKQTAPNETGWRQLRRFS